jgi:thiol:disulfide interchange protein DsbD
MQRLPILPFLGFLLLFAQPSAAQFELPGASPQSTSELLSEVRSIAPGKPFTLALRLSHPDKWHSYYLNTGGVELPPSINWSLPEGFLAGPIQWPVPSVKDGFFGKSFVMEGEPVLLVEITPPAGLATGEKVTLKAEASWQICEESCINEEASFTLSLPVAAAAEIDEAQAAMFQQARASQPVKPVGWTISADSADGGILLTIETDGSLTSDPVDFVPDQPFVKSISSGGSLEREGRILRLRLPIATKDALDNEIPAGDSFSGILLGGPGKPSFAIPETRIGSAAEAPAAPVSLSAGRYIRVLWGMLIGGLILNLMPCVFPVIGLKIMGFVQQAGSDRRKIALHGLTFTLGVLASFGVLSGILFAARETIGWGYQLQDPWVVFVLMLLMFVLALNMFGVFEIGTSATSLGGSLQTKQGLAGSFFSGVLATVVATPCSGPFLGVAIGAAISLPALQFFLAFGAMALGLALPYLILSVFPQLIDSLPRPGPWMESFKQAMSFLLFATAGYLLWVYAGLIELDNLLGPIFGLSAIAVAAWVHGRWNLPHRKHTTRRTAVLFAMAFAIGGLWIAKPPQASELKWQTWSAETEASLLKQGKPVYVDFTAQWCATCQVNKKRAYTPEVIRLMNRKGVVALKADKTRPNEEIETALKKLGRTAIPVNVLHLPGKEPVIFPELLSPTHLLEAFREIKP